MAKVVGGGPGGSESGGARGVLCGLYHALHPRNLATTIRARLSDLNGKKHLIKASLIVRLARLCPCHSATGIFLVAYKRLHMRVCPSVR